MSFIIASDHGAIPSDELIENALQLNPNGWGLMYNKGGQLQVHKGFELDTLLNHLRKIEHTPYVLHCRKSYQPDTAPENNEPYKLFAGCWMAFDGITRHIEELDPKRPRSYNFSLNITDMAELNPEWFKGENLVGYLDRWMDKNAVAAVMFSGSDEILLMHQASWSEYRGMWLSDREPTPEYIEQQFQLEQAKEAAKIAKQIEAPKTAGQAVGKVAPIPVAEKYPPCTGAPVVNLIEGEELHTDDPEPCDWCQTTVTDRVVYEGQLICRGCKRLITAEPMLFEGGVQELGF